MDLGLLSNHSLSGPEGNPPASLFYRHRVFLALQFIPSFKDPSPNLGQFVESDEKSASC